MTVGLFSETYIMVNGEMVDYKTAKEIASSLNEESEIEWRLATYEELQQYASSEMGEIFWSSEITVEGSMLTEVKVLHMEGRIKEYPIEFEASVLLVGKKRDEKFDVDRLIQGEHLSDSTLNEDDLAGLKWQLNTDDDFRKEMKDRIYSVLGRDTDICYILSSDFECYVVIYLKDFTIFLQEDGRLSQYENKILIYK